MRRGGQVKGGGDPSHPIPLNAAAEHMPQDCTPVLSGTRRRTPRWNCSPGWLPSYDPAGVLHGHIAWHAALLALERGDLNRAIALYEQHVQPSASAGLPINVVSDGASFLWRVQAYGHQPPAGRWTELAAYAAKAFPKPGQAFVDTHMALIEAATGDIGAVEQRAEALAAMAASGALGAGSVAPALCRAALAFAEQDYARCADILEPLLPEVARIGGSGAQREVHEDTLIVALMRAGEADRARTHLDRRLHRRPSPRDHAWRERSSGPREG
jgi:hypothetical protein